MNENPSKFSDPPQDEPLFTKFSQTDAAMQSAFKQAAATIPQFIKHMENRGEGHLSVKICFRDPDESDRLGEDRFFYLWLTHVFYYPDENNFTAMFFSLPPEILKWVQVGQYYLFGPVEIADWMVLEAGRLHGGFTLRVTREKLPAGEREAYDRYLGVSVYETLPA